MTWHIAVPGTQGVLKQYSREVRGAALFSSPHEHGHLLRPECGLWWRREAARWTRWSQACDLDNAHGWLRTSRAPAAGHTVGSCSLCTLP